MLANLNKDGYVLTNDESQAEIIIVNTCCFIDSAKQESIDTILDLAKNKKEGNLKCLIVAGCMGERFSEEILEELPEVDGVCGTGDFDDICSVIQNTLKKRGVYKKGCENAPLECSERILATPPYTAYIKIAEGCNNNCTYCVIPSIRGRYRSREMENIIAEANLLAENGVRELIVIAQDTSSYGIDLYG
jgi:ribosomal protein S12 methylthiotransferase